MWHIFPYWLSTSTPTIATEVVVIEEPGDVLVIESSETVIIVDDSQVVVIENGSMSVTEDDEVLVSQCC